MKILKAYNALALTDANTQNGPLKFSEPEKARYISGLKATKFRKN